MSEIFPAVDCPVCPYPHLWKGAEKCPVCHGAGKISIFKRPGVYLQYPELARMDTEREMPAVHPEEKKT